MSVLKVYGRLRSLFISGSIMPSVIPRTPAVTQSIGRHNAVGVLWEPIPGPRKDLAFQKKLERRGLSAQTVHGTQWWALNDHDWIAKAYVQLIAVYRTENAASTVFWGYQLRDDHIRVSPMPREEIQEYLTGEEFNMPCLKHMALVGTRAGCDFVFHLQSDSGLVLCLGVRHVRWNRQR
jgi:hypothetical protein